MRYRKFQLDDCARGALVSGFINGWATGLGKGVAAFTQPLLWLGWDDLLDKLCPPRLVPKGRVLLVIPGGLHRRMINEGRDKFGLTLQRLPDQETFLKLTRNGTHRLPDGFYLTSYTELTRNGVRKPESISAASGVGRYTADGRIRCVFSPTLAELCCREFNCVAIDEGVKMQSGESQIGEGIRRMDPPYRMVLTATPIKNRLPQLFFLASWVTGGGNPQGPRTANARFPWNATLKDQREFTRLYMVEERNLTKEADAEALDLPKPRKKHTAEVTNVHGLWKTFGGLILRRRKEDCGEPLVKKIRQIVRVPMGLEQSLVYCYHLLAKHVDENGKRTVLPTLQNLRIAASNPASALLEAARSEALTSKGRMKIEQPDELLALPFRSAQSYTPKLSAALLLLAGALERREQILFFGCFQDSLDVLAVYLKQTGVRFGIADGRMNPDKRGRLSEQFERQEFPVLLANLDSMAEGNNFYLCKNVVNMAYHWAWDLFEQGINRIHRLTTPEDVNVWGIITEGTIERRLEELTHEKADSQELVLDGKLISEPHQELSLADIFDVAQHEFDPQASTIDERTLKSDWPTQAARLRELARVWTARPMGRSSPPTNIIRFPIIPGAAGEAFKTAPAQMPWRLCSRTRPLDQSATTHRK